MIEKTVLKNGIRAVYEKMPDCRSASVAVWVKSGSVYEAEKEHGMSHFIEHILFKGTKSRSASKIAAEMDDIGGNLNAFTSKECTCFYAKVLDEHIEKAVDIMSDLILRSKLDAGDIEREKGVVTEEILMNDDSPEDVANEGICSLLYEGCAVAPNILGTADSVNAFTRQSLIDYMDKRYRGGDTVISVAGSLDKTKLDAMLWDKFGAMRAGVGEERIPSAIGAGGRVAFADRDAEQAHICIGMPGFGANDDRRFAMLVLSNVLGGCMSSRLFQRIREERGLAYSTYTYPTSYAETGYLTAYAGTGLANAAKVTELILSELASARKDGITKTEFDRAKEQMRVSYILSSESTSARSSAIGKAELLLGRAEEEARLIKKLEAVSMADVEGILNETLDPNNMCAFVAGKTAGMDTRAIERLIKG